MNIESYLKGANRGDFQWAVVEYNDYADIDWGNCHCREEKV